MKNLMPIILDPIFSSYFAISSFFFRNTYLSAITKTYDLLNLCYLR
jgi:hypothetical protein